MRMVRYVCPNRRPTLTLHFHVMYFRRKLVDLRSDYHRIAVESKGGLVDGGLVRVHRVHERAIYLVYFDDHLPPMLLRSLCNAAYRRIMRVVAGVPFADLSRSRRESRFLSQSGWWPILVLRENLRVARSFFCINERNRFARGEVRCDFIFRATNLKDPLFRAVRVCLRTVKDWGKAMLRNDRVNFRRLQCVLFHFYFVMSFRYFKGGQLKRVLSFRCFRFFPRVIVNLYLREDGCTRCRWRCREWVAGFRVCGLLIHAGSSLAGGQGEYLGATCILVGVAGARGRESFDTTGTGITTPIFCEISSYLQTKEGRLSIPSVW